MYPDGSTFAAINRYNQCVLTQILDDAPCGGALTQLIDEHGLTLTPAQQLNLVGPGGSVGNMCGENSDFEDLVKAELIKECIDEGLVNSSIQFDLPLTVFDDICNDSDSSNPITCDNCTPSQLQILQTNHTAALNKLDCAIMQVENFASSNPTGVSSCMQQFFGTNSLTSSVLLTEWLKVIKAVLKNQEYIIRPTGVGRCRYTPPTQTEPESGTVAWTLPGAILFRPFISIRICDPWYFSFPPNEQTLTIIHEASHIGLGTADWAYVQEPEFANLWTILQMTNADNFSEFTNCLCP